MVEDCLFAPSEVVCNMIYWCPLSVLLHAPSEVAQNPVESVKLLEDAPSVVVAVSVLLLVALVQFFLTVLLM